jgi:3',5'-cyclic AMP phosphodiesterase CpdA
MALPLVVFWTAGKGGCVLPLEDAKRLFRRELLEVLEKAPTAVARILAREANKRKVKRILHISDLHIGDRHVDARRGWLKEHLSGLLPTVDRTVITGDLFDRPTEEFRESFDEFRADLERVSPRPMLVVPGNHDVRSRGTALGPFRRRAEYACDLAWEPFVVDDELQAVFFAFNSAERGNLAKGIVSERQRRSRAVSYEAELKRRPEIEAFYRIALVHHHPYAYDGSSPSALYERFLAKVFGGEEKVIAFEDAGEFMRWCNSRVVSLVLHGHKHVPHLIKTSFENAQGRHDITVVGCGSSTGVDGRPMSYDIVAFDPVSKVCNVAFYQAPKGDGVPFELQNVAIDLRGGSFKDIQAPTSLPAGHGALDGSVTTTRAPRGTSKLGPTGRGSEAPAERTAAIASVPQAASLDFPEGLKRPRAPKAVSEKQPVFKGTFARNVRSLKVSAPILESVRAVTMHKKYPFWMSIAGTLGRNPVWQGIPRAKARKMGNEYITDGSTPPKIMHLDVLLLRRNDSKGRGQLHTYFSNDWGTYLLHFRQRIPGENDSQRSELSARKVARQWSIDAGLVEVRPLDGKYAVSVKPHPRYLDLIVYIFEFCSVEIKERPGSSLGLAGHGDPDDHQQSSRWLSLSDLRNDPVSRSVNGDVIRAIYDLFTFDLVALPASFI